MSFGMDVGVKRTRSFTGENTAGVSSDIKKSRKEEPVNVTVYATFNGTAYDLTVAAAGERATRSDVDPVDLADTIARLIDKVAKAVAAGETAKHRQPQSPIFRGNDFTRKSKRDVFSG